MRKFMDVDGIQRLEQYFRMLGDVLGNESRRGSFAIYAMGLLGDAERKSIEPIAARACPNPRETDAMHQRLLHFAVDSQWSDREVRREASQYALSAMTQREPVEAWIVDDTGFLKQGTHSVGVQRQYTGSAGKITNCQIGVSLSIATRTEHVPIDFELYLPESWTNNIARLQEARVPEDVTFKTKPQLALQMIRRAVADGVPKGIVLADSAYGTSGEFRAQIRSLGLHYAVGVEPQTTISLLDNQGRPQGEAMSVKDIASSINERGGFRRCTWRAGTNEDLWARFAMRRVVAAGVPESQQEPLWLLIEWRDGEPAPANYFLVSVPRRMTKKQLIRLVMQRWRTERVYQDLKGELGLDHYEGRRFPGWHHHVSVALCCYAFIIAERVRHFPPLGPRDVTSSVAATRGLSAISTTASLPRGSPSLG
jgi:SRSO17 transposase